MPPAYLPQGVLQKMALASASPISPKPEHPVTSFYGSDPQTSTDISLVITESGVQSAATDERSRRIVKGLETQQVRSLGKLSVRSW